MQTTTVARFDAREYGRKSYDDPPNQITAALSRIQGECVSWTERADERIQTVSERVAAIEQSVAKQSKGECGPYVGALFDRNAVADDPDFRKLQAGTKGANCTIKLDRCSAKSLFNDMGEADTGNALYPTQPQRLGIYTGPQRPLSLFDVLPVVSTRSNAVEYVRLTLDGEAGVQPGEGELKQRADFGAELETARIETVAVWTGISAQCLSDTESLVNAVGTLMRNAVRDKSEQQLFVGSGVGSGFWITGLYTGAVPLVAHENAVPDRIGRAITEMESAGYQPSLIALNPADWFSVTTTKNADGDYQHGSPTNPVRPSLWNRPVLVSASVPSGTALVIDTSKVAILDREQPTLYLTRDFLDWSARNLCMVLAEMRLGLAVYQLEAVRKVDLTAAT